MDIAGEVTISIGSFRELLEKAKKLETLEEDRISAEDKALMVYSISYTYMVLNSSLTSLCKTAMYSYVYYD